MAGINVDPGVVDAVPVRITATLLRCGCLLWLPFLTALAVQNAVWEG